MGTWMTLAFLLHSSSEEGGAAAASAGVMQHQFCEKRHSKFHSANPRVIRHEVLE